MEKTFKAVIFIDSNNSQQQSYIAKQILAIKKQLPDLVINLENENSLLMQRYAKHPNRVPCYMIFKNDIYKNSRQAKLSDAEAIKWIKLMTS